MTSKKNDIICTVATLFHCKGYENTKLGEVLTETGIGKGQFYHYFKSKWDLGEAVIDHIILEMAEGLFDNILDQPLPPKVKLKKMLDKILILQLEHEGKRGCPLGNLAIELSEHDPIFREKLARFFEQWVEKVQQTLDEMKQNGEISSKLNTVKKARAMIATIEGGILLMKCKQDVEVFRDIIEMIQFEYRI
ncbi:TetR/AcrR family transcriptional regulator [Litchfieldia alkalitelluris]|uniref:TetR/AcrR family transcriptional regulator n=1 Tax=Litchfieldia alkalitelluris TaxID=304268 RepID=UPI000998C313|nr:TetR/AcrR family transcriptional regulator [Litchfieldia alkalitelluris]